MKLKQHLFPFENERDESLNLALWHQNNAGPERVKYGRGGGGAEKGGGLKLRSL